MIDNYDETWADARELFDRDPSPLFAAYMARATGVELRRCDLALPCDIAFPISPSLLKSVPDLS